MNLENMPRACTKEELNRIFSKEPINVLRNTINEIMAENRKKPISVVKYKKTVRINEVRTLMDILGYEVEKETATV